MLVFERIPQTRCGGASTSFLLGLVRLLLVRILHGGEAAVLVAGVEEDDEERGAERGDAAAQPCRWAPLLLDIMLRLLLPALAQAQAEACGCYGHGYECHVPGSGVVAPAHGCSQRFDGVQLCFVGMQ